MQTLFQRTLHELLLVSGKSLNQVATLGNLDRAYLIRLLSGEKQSPSPEVIVRIWIGLCTDPEVVKHHPTFPTGLAQLMLAAGLSQYANANSAER